MKNFKMLYLSCHSIAEYDEVKIFKELGIDVFAHGSYQDPNNPGDPKRPPLWGTADKRLIDLASKNPKENMSKEFLDNFDVIISHWVPAWIVNNFDKMRGKKIIFRTNGQSTVDNEYIISKFRQGGVKVVRYSEMERLIPKYCGEDAIIRFYKDPEEWKNWNGSKNQIITVCQSMKRRADCCNYNIFNQATLGLPVILYGNDNAESGDLWGGCLSYDDLRQVMRDSRVYFYTGSTPACYTLNFIEAWMTGIPIVSIGPEYGNPNFLREQKTFEIHRLIRNGENGFVADDVGELHEYCKQLLNSKTFAKKIGKAGRKSAIEIFGKEKIKKQWREFFDNL